VDDPSQDEEWDGHVVALHLTPVQVGGQFDVDHDGGMEQVEHPAGQRGDGLAAEEVEDRVVCVMLAEEERTCKDKRKSHTCSLIGQSNFSPAKCQSP